MAKTPQFDKALNEILKNLVSHERMCRECDRSFEIKRDDIDFYDMFRVPPPTLCPLCRKKRRFGHLMRVPKFFKKTCSAPGHNEEVITVFPPNSPHRVYDFSFYRSDGWDATAYGRDFDFSKTFFDQFKKLFFEVPHVALERDPLGVGVEYTLGGKGGKNNYYSAMAFESQECLYVVDVRFSNNIVDSHLVMNSDFCYESMSTAFSNRGIYLDGCSQCIDSAFLYDCKNCSNCFLSNNLRNKSHVFRNQQLSKEDYEKNIKELDLGDRTVFKKCLEEYGEIMNRALRRSVQTVNCVDCLGDSLAESRDCFSVFRSQKSEHCRYAENLYGCVNVMDSTNVLGECFYEGVVCTPGNAAFSMYIRNSSFIEYSSECYDCQYCFGCVGLRNKSFHIFNRPYKESDYWLMLDRIKEKMLKEGEYGDFFDIRLGLMPYQSSSGQYYFPLDREEVNRRGIPWYEEIEGSVSPNMRLRNFESEVPRNISDVNDDITDGAIVCVESGKPFRITPSELRFYKNMIIPIPSKHPWQRMIERKGREHSFVLFEFECPKCHEHSFSIYSPEEQKRYTVFCEKCYLKEVI